ncbi:MAG: redoxin domain-containing protein [Dehalococcoidia bacterium]|nr:redoxin domain-containing protein [Dehalococcoidia bacterium]
MRRRVIFLFAALVPVAALLGLMAWALAQSGGNPGGLLVRNVFGEVAVKERPAPPFILPILDGTALELSDLKGKWVMVDFWSSWCPPCIEEAPVLVSTYRQFAGQGVEFVGVAIWDEEEAVRGFVQRYSISYPSGFDANGKIAIDYSMRGIPEKFFIDPDGRLVRKFVGPATQEKLGAILDELLAQGKGG